MDQGITNQNTSINLSVNVDGNDTTTSTLSHGLSKETRIDIKLIKYELHNILYKKGSHNWTKYWNSVQQFLSTKLSALEFHKIVKSLFGDENVHLHNKFITAIFHNVNSLRLPMDYEKYLPSGTSVGYQQLVRTSSLDSADESSRPSIVAKKATKRSHLVSGSTYGKSAIVWNTNIPEYSIVCTKRKYTPCRMNLDIYNDKQGIQKMLEITRCKNMRSRCKLTDQQSSALHSDINFAISRRIHQGSLNARIYYPTKSSSSNSSSSNPIIPDALLRSSFGSSNSQTYKAQQAQIKKLSRSFNELRKKTRMPKPVTTFPLYTESEVVDDVMKIERLMKLFAEQFELDGITPQAIQAMKQASLNYLSNILLASIEESCHDYMIPMKKRKGDAQSFRCNVELMSKNELSWTKCVKLNYPMHSLTWPNPKNFTQNKVKQSENVLAPRNKSKSKAMVPNHSLHVSGTNEAKPYIVTMNHLHEGLLNYPNLSGPNRSFNEEKLASKLFNKY